MSKIIGMSRNIKLEWLNEVAFLVSENKEEQEIKDILNDYLGAEIASPTNLRKTREILMNIWVRYGENEAELKSLALELFKTNNKKNKLVAHWCMILITYPVFKDIVTVLGKMADKQYDITSGQLRNKMFDVWGERSTLYHSIDKNISTLKNMDILKTIKTGVYDLNNFVIESEQAINLIVKVSLFLRDKLYMDIDELQSCYEFYPFNYNIDLQALELSNLFEFDRFGGELVVSSK